MHFAGEALVAKSVREPSTFYAANIAAGVNLLDAVTRHGVKKFIFSSTAATYGEPHTVPIPEDHSKNPINPYGKSKLRFEEILSDYRAYTGLHFATLRYFNAAGASAERGEHHRSETHLIPRVLDVATGVIPHVEVFGSDYSTPDGTCVRDYVHVLDIADSHLRALESIDRVSGEAFNVGTNRGYSIFEVLESHRTRHRLQNSTQNLPPPPRRSRCARRQHGQTSPRSRLGSPALLSRRDHHLSLGLEKEVPARLFRSRVWLEALTGMLFRGRNFSSGKKLKEGRG